METSSDHPLEVDRWQERGKTLIRFEEVCHWYKDTIIAERTLALRKLNLEIRRGEFLALWGPSGSGKSTLCNLAGGLDAPKEGRVIWEEVCLSDFSDDDLSAKRNSFVGFIFQQFNLIPVLSALENVLLPHQINAGRGGRREGEFKARRLFEELEIAELAHRRPDQLSGGQRQRVAIARALINAPPLVIADEPTANLDTRNAEHLVRLMRERNRNHGTTFLFATHDERLLASVDRKLHLVDGEWADGTRGGA